MASNGNGTHHCRCATCGSTTNTGRVIRFKRTRKGGHQQTVCQCPECADRATYVSERAYMQRSYEAWKARRT